MKLILILAGPYSSCLSTQQTWQDACHKHQLKLEIYNMEDEQGRAIIREYELKSFPALIANGKITAVGHPDTQTANTIISNLITETNNK